MKIMVTGASRGLGLELVKTGLQHGHSMVAAWLGAPEDPRELFALGRTYPDTLKMLEMDVTSEESVAGASKTVAADGPVDCVINNAGVMFESRFDKIEPVVELDIAMLRKTIEVNTVGPAIVLKHFAPQVYVSKEPCIINITSEAGHLEAGGHCYLAYGISKHGANMYTQKIRNFFAHTPQHQNIRIFMLHPGRMNTVMGKENAQMEPRESAEGIFDVIEKRIDPKLEIPFINYKGEQMPY